MEANHVHHWYGKEVCADPGAFHYQRHRPEKTILYLRGAVSISMWPKRSRRAFSPRELAPYPSGGDYGISLTMRFYVPDHEPFKTWTPQKAKRVK